MKKDHTFLLSFKDEEKLAIAFCDSAKVDRLGAKQEIEQILSTEAKDSYQLSYLGTLDYTDMDPEIANKLHYFEKYEKVWLLR
ncbi:hypothetical protein [Neobacillus niacini]|uniref:hypothetical protein n=1 Tax=Neobacillus niacini TaxID=86668 RepID=UPI0021CAFA90|nr:hypothetical protein [Neobacillus niacini]MCM3766371.1 hypothetical protein [Neobacillus niacini]